MKNLGGDMGSNRENCFKYEDHFKYIFISFLLISFTAYPSQTKNDSIFLPRTTTSFIMKLSKPL